MTAKTSIILIFKFAVSLQLFSQRSSYQHFLEFFLLHQWGIEACELALNSRVLRDIFIENNKYDVILLEQFNSDCMMAVAWKIKAPVIGLSSCVLMPWHYDRLGNPLNPSYVPGLFLGYSDEMHFLERISNWIAVNGLNFMYQ